MNLYVTIVSLSLLIDIYGVYEAICDQQYSDALSEKAGKNRAHQDDAKVQDFDGIDAEHGDIINDFQDDYGREDPFLLYKSYTNYMTEEDIEVNDLIEDDEESVSKKRVVRDITPNIRGRGNEDGRRRRRNEDGRRRRGPKGRSTTATPVVNERNEREGSRQPRHQIHQQRQGPEQAENKTCFHCLWREERKNLRLATIKQDILRKVQMEVPPNNTHFPREPVEVLMGDRTINASVLRAQHDEPQVEEAADRTQIVTFSESPPSSLQLFQKSSFDPKDVMYFKLQQDILKSRLHHATLYIYAKKYTYQADVVKHLKVYRIIQRHYRDDYTFFPEADVSKKISLTSSETGKWIQLNLTSVVEKWMSPCHRQGCAHGFENYGLYVSFKDFESNNIAVIKPMTEEEKNYKPFLQTEQSDRGSIRRKRRLQEHKDCEEDNQENRCCRYELVVDFDNFGWDWIMQPRSYQAFYCAGECPYAYRSETAHAHIVQMSKTEHAPGGPCCTPVKMSNQSFLYFDDMQRLIFKNLEDMVVDICGCN